VLAVQLFLYMAWLAFLGWMISKGIEKGRPPVRAALSVLCGVAISWVPTVIRERFDFDRYVPDTIGIDHLALHIGVPVAIFLGLWWWLGRRQRRDEYIRIFE
jgi:hypothetical protein